MSNKFEVGDRVRVVLGEWEVGKVFIIDEIDGNDDNGWELPYRGKGTQWHKATDLVMVQPRYAKIYSTHDAAQQPVRDSDAGAGDAGRSYAGVEAQKFLDEKLMNALAELAATRERLAAAEAALRPFAAFGAERLRVKPEFTCDEAATDVLNDIELTIADWQRAVDVFSADGRAG